MASGLCRGVREVCEGSINTVIASHRVLAMTEERAVFHIPSSYPRRRVSSTPRPLGSIIAASGILVHPRSRVMTTEHVSAISRLTAPEFCKFIRPQREGAGKTGCTLHPRSRVQTAHKNAHEHTGSAEAVRPSLRNGFTAYIVLSSVTGLCCHRRAQEALASQELDASVGASGPHDFAVRVAPFVLRAPARPPHPAPYVRDDRDTPLLWARDGRAGSADLPDGESGIFFEGGLDRKSLICPSGKNPRRHCESVGWAKGALAPCPPFQTTDVMVGTRSLSSGAHSRDPLALPTLRSDYRPTN
jgi:hypothetical protein